MANKDFPSIKFYTPKGVAVWPRLVRPDTKFNEDGVYKTDLAFDAEDSAASKMFATLEKYRDVEFKKWAVANKKKAKTATIAPVAVEETDDEGDPTGRRLLRTKLPAMVRPKKGEPFTLKPSYWDASKTRVPQKKCPDIGGGSTIRLKVEARTYFMETSKTFGVTVRIIAVQIINLVKFDGDAAGFDDEEDGFEAEAGGADDDEDAEDAEDAEEDDDDDDDADKGGGYNF